MKVFMVGGTDLLSFAAARLFVEKGYAVKSVVPAPPQDGLPIPTEMELVFDDYLKMSDQQLLSMMEGCDAFVFAAGVGECAEYPAPVYEAYRKYNIQPVRRLLTLVKQCGIKNNVILGSYFSYFAKVFPDMHLTEFHPYIRSCVEQEHAALGFADDETNVCVLELPYIVGSQAGSQSARALLPEKIYGMGKTGHVTMCPKGGTAMITLRQAAQVVVGAVECNKGGNTYPIGYYNLTWDDYVQIALQAMDAPDRRVVHVAKWMLRMHGKKQQKACAARGAERGFDAAEIPDIIFTDMFVDKKWAVSLGATEDDIKAAIYDSVRLSEEADPGTKNACGDKK